MSFFEFPHTRTYDSDLGWLIKDAKTTDDLLKALNEWAANAEIRLEDIEAFKDALNNGNLPLALKNALFQWAALNVPQLISAAIKTVFFDLTPDGYLRVTIPDSWSDIIFGTTGLDTFPPGYEYGHLTLTY